MRRAFGSRDVKLVPMMNWSFRLLPALLPIKDQPRLMLIALAVLLVSLADTRASAQDPSLPQRDALTVEGTVRNSAGEPVADATVLLEGKDHSHSAEMKTKADGTFVFSVFDPGTYILRVEKSGWRNSVSSSLAMSEGAKKHVDLVLESLAHPDSSGE